MGIGREMMKHSFEERVLMAVFDDLCGKNPAGVMQAIDTLSPRSAQAIKCRYGFDGADPMKLREIGLVLGNKRTGDVGLSPETVRQLISRTLRQLRHPVRNHFMRRTAV